MSKGQGEGHRALGLALQRWQNTGDTLVGVETYLRLPRREVSTMHGRVEISATLDITGDGSLTAPLDGPAHHWAWQWQDTAISEHQWQHIDNTAAQPTLEPEEID